MASDTPSVMSKPRTDLDPPKDTPFTLNELKKYDGTSSDGLIYVSVKGQVFDVTSKKEMYGPGASYNLFAGKDGSKGLGLSSLKPEDAVPDWSTLGEAERKVLEQWHSFFTLRYNIVGKVTDLPENVSHL